MVEAAAGKNDMLINSVRILVSASRRPWEKGSVGRKVTRVSGVREGIFSH